MAPTLAKALGRSEDQQWPRPPSHQGTASRPQSRGSVRRFSGTAGRPPSSLGSTVGSSRRPSSIGVRATDCMQEALGLLPHCAGSLSKELAILPGNTPRERAPSNLADEDFTMVIGSLGKDLTMLPSSTPRERPSSNLADEDFAMVPSNVCKDLTTLPSNPAREKAPSNLADEGVLHINELKSWLQPRKSEGGFVSALKRVSLDVDAFVQDSIAYRGGPCSEDNPAWLDAAGGNPLPLLPERTAQAVSLLLRVVRCLPRDALVAHLLEPLLQEVLTAVYQHWPDRDSAAALPEVDLEHLQKMTTYYMVVGGYKAKAAEAAKKATEEKCKADRYKLQALPREAALSKERQHRKALEAKLEEVQKARKAAEERAEDAEINYETFKQDSKRALGNLSELRFKEEIWGADQRRLEKEVKERDAVIADQQEKLGLLSHCNNTLESQLSEANTELKTLREDASCVAHLRQVLEVHERNESYFGLGFAERVAHEIFGTSLEELCSQPSNTPRAQKSEKQKGSARAKQLLDMTCWRLRALPAQIEELKTQLRRLKMELQETRELIPVWNASMAEDLADAFDEDASVCQQVLSTRDTRQFAALGLEENVPPYLRAEGFVNHIFLSKVEARQFIQGFFRRLLPDEGNVMADLGSAEHRVNKEAASTERLHEYLHKHLKKIHSGEKLTEFAYALMCSVEAHRECTDFELFDLLLRGIVHPALIASRQEMLKDLNSLLQLCKESEVEERPAGGRHMASTTSLAPGEQAADARERRELISSRVIRAALQAFFPAKTAERQNALRRALHETVLLLSGGGSGGKPSGARRTLYTTNSQGPDYVFISDLFATSAEGERSRLVEEILRQNYHEVVEYVAHFTRRIRAAVPPGDKELLDHKSLRKVLGDTCPQATGDYINFMIQKALDTAEAAPVADVLQKLRHRTFLHPRLWVKAQTKDVVHNLVHMGPEAKEVMDNTQGSTPPGELESPSWVPPRRCRAVKVVDNPMHSESYSTADGIEKAVVSEGHHLAALEDVPETLTDWPLERLPDRAKTPLQGARRPSRRFRRGSSMHSMRSVRSAGSHSSRGGASPSHSGQHLETPDWHIFKDDSEMGHSRTSTFSRIPTVDLDMVTHSAPVGSFRHPHFGESQAHFAS